MSNPTVFYLPAGTTSVSTTDTTLKNLTSSFNLEVLRSTAADQTLTTNLGNEIERASSAEAQLTNDLAAEVTRATDAETALDAKFNTVGTRYPMQDTLVRRDANGNFEANMITANLIGVAADVTNVSVMNKKLEGYVQAPGTIIASDTILQAFEKLGAPTNANTANQIVRRDASGNFSAGTITAALNGNAATVTTNANLTGEVTSAGNATTVTNAAVIGKLLTGYTPSTGTIAATDSILQAFSKLGAPTNANTANQIVRRDASGNFSAGTITAALNGNAATVTTNANLTGEVTSVGNATTVTNAAVLGKVLTGLSATAGTVLETDTILQALGKTTGNLALYNGAGVSTATPSRLAMRDANADIAFRDIDCRKLVNGGTTIFDVVSSNTLIGPSAGNATMTGTDNSYVGRQVGTATTTGYYNTAEGRYALSALSTGTSNSAYGWGALRNYLNSNSSAFGAGALTSQTTGGSSSAFGYFALGSATTGSQNCAFGTESEYLGTTATRNSGFGWRSLYNNQTGADNTALGHYAGQYCQGTQNTFLGSGTDFNALATYVNSTAIGYGAVVNASNQMRLGNSSLATIETSATINAPTINAPTLNSSNVNATNVNAGVNTGNILAALGWQAPTVLGGGYLGWNRSSGGGETVIANTPGLGAGGFQWAQYSSDLQQSKTTMTLSAAGSLTIPKQLYATASVWYVYAMSAVASTFAQTIGQNPSTTVSFANGSLGSGGITPTSLTYGYIPEAGLYRYSLSLVFRRTDSSTEDVSLSVHSNTAAALSPYLKFVKQWDNSYALQTTGYFVGDGTVNQYIELRAFSSGNNVGLAWNYNTAGFVPGCYFLLERVN